MSEAEHKYGYIFDFDGVLVNTMGAHFECYQQALAEVNVPIDRALFYSQAGMTGLEQIQSFADRAGVQVDAKAVYARKREIWENHPPHVTPIRCNLQLMRALRDRGVRVAVATGSSPPTILPIMRQLGIEVDAIVTAHDVKRGKPFPDLFLCAAERLGLPPQHCIVVEDSDVGIEAAQAAGMRAMRFYDAMTPDGA
ncbi:MAG: HAD family phosphatase [Anaerolineales bacterium]|nr:HAD family phosphatase [Anaerolineales bacterium]